jgi:hypothetical protein
MMQKNEKIDNQYYIINITAQENAQDLQTKERQGFL